VEIEDVIICYAKLFEDNDISRKKAKKLIKYTKELVKRGWKIDQITRKICSYHNKKGQENDIDKVFSTIFKGKKAPLKRENNLLEDKRYYHSELIRTSSKRRNINVRNGEVQVEDPPFYLYNVEIYRLENLLSYYMEYVNREDITDRLKKYNKKVLENTVNTRDLDLILFTIDYIRKSSGRSSISFPSSARKLINYFQEGREYYNNVKKNLPDKLHPFYKAYIEKVGGTDE